AFRAGLHWSHGMSSATRQRRFFSAWPKKSRYSVHIARSRSGGRVGAGSSISPGGGGAGQRAAGVSLAARSEYRMDIEWFSVWQRPATVTGRLAGTLFQELV